MKMIGATAIDRFNTYQVRLSQGKGLLAWQWDDWERLYKFFDPEGYQRKLWISYAEKLSIDDLKEIIRKMEGR